MSRRFIVVGNWKMNKTSQSAVEFAKALPPLMAPNYLAVPFTCLEALTKLDVPMLQVGVQNVYFQKEGAVTGEISAFMAKASGAEFSIVGHSERRQIFQESNAFVNKKIKACLLEDLIPIVCIGESAIDREEGRAQEFLKKQLIESLLEVEKEAFSKIMIAYEPIWAIGTGKPATAQSVQEIHFLIRKWIREKWGEEISENLSILYGGSVVAETIPSLKEQPDIDGVLVGGASLKIDAYTQIIQSVEGTST